MDTTRTLPSGTVTFLFTDIEGSTRLWEQHPGAMHLALARHDALLRVAIESNGGHVFKRVGDAFYAAFAMPSGALDAALAGQRHLLVEVATAQAGLNLKARMAIHTGEAEAREGDYYRQPLNRIARLLGVGHGGQVLLSAATQGLVRDDLPP